MSPSSFPCRRLEIITDRRQCRSEGEGLFAMVVPLLAGVLTYLIAAALLAAPAVTLPSKSRGHERSSRGAVTRLRTR